ncbi:hypothetical protein WMY93_021908 [Mugilogobius chulae]|uniref:Uncharacterized protein n=1 Tax=Mugilogobius chulae TaxID=88201 RepID=A0AAW0NP67_9GOBI
MKEDTEVEMEMPEENEAGSVVILEDERSSDRIVRTEEGMTRWSQNASLSQALFELAEKENIQVKATSVSVCMVWILVGDEEVIAEGATREEASVKAISLALEGLKKQTRAQPDPVLETKDPGFGSGFFNWWYKETVCEEEERVVETEEKREIAEEDKGSSGNEYETASDGYCSSLELQEEEKEAAESCPGPSSVFESEEDGSNADVITLDDLILYPDLEDECMERRIEEEEPQTQS